MTRTFTNTIDYNTFLPFIGQQIELCANESSLTNKNKLRKVLWEESKVIFNTQIEDSKKFYDNSQLAGCTMFMKIGLLRRLSQKSKEMEI